MNRFYLSRSRTALGTSVGLFVSCYLVQVAVSQQAPPGVFRFVNATLLPEKVFLTIDNLKLKPEGFAAGDTTGAIGIAPGPRRFTISSANSGTAQAAVSVQPNTSTSIIAYCKFTVDPQTRKVTQALQLLTRQNPPRARGRDFQLLFVSSHPSIDLSINGQNRSVKALREIGGADLPSGEIKIDYAGKPLTSFTAPEAGNFLVVIFDDPAGKVRGVVVPDYG